MRDAQVDMRKSHGALKNNDDLRLLEQFRDFGVSRDAFQKAWCEDFIFVMRGLPYKTRLVYAQDQLISACT